MQIKKRNGSVVDFDALKITNAMKKAFQSLNVDVSDEVLKEITDSVVASIENDYVDAVPSVENVQDRVEFALMQGGYHTIAKHYIVYRYEHTKIREEKKQEVVEKDRGQSLARHHTVRKVRSIR